MVSARQCVEHEALGPRCLNPLIPIIICDLFPGQYASLAGWLGGQVAGRGIR